MDDFATGVPSSVVNTILTMDPGSVDDPGSFGTILFYEELFGDARVFLEEATSRGQKHHAYLLYKIYYHGFDNKAHSLVKAAQMFYMAAEAGDVDVLAIIDEQMPELYDLEPERCISFIVAQWTTLPSLAGIWKMRTTGQASRKYHTR